MDPMQLYMQQLLMGAGAPQAPAQQQAPMPMPPVAAELAPKMAGSQMGAGGLTPEALQALLMGQGGMAGMGGNTWDPSGSAAAAGLYSPLLLGNAPGAQLPYSFPTGLPFIGMGMGGPGFVPGPEFYEQRAAEQTHPSRQDEGIAGTGAQTLNDLLALAPGTGRGPNAFRGLSQEAYDAAVAAGVDPTRTAEEQREDENKQSNENAQNTGGGRATPDYMR